MNTEPTSAAASADAAKSRLTRKLPTFRVGFSKQMDALRAYAMLSDNGTKPVHYTRIAEIIKVHEANVSSMNPFFVESGLIIKASNGYLPSSRVLDYNRAFAWNQDTAAEQLRPLIGDTWFGVELGQRLAFRPMSEETAIEVLASKCNAGPETKPQLRILLDFCEATGIIVRANGQLTIGIVSGPVDLEPSLDPPLQTESLQVPPQSFRGASPSINHASPQSGAVHLDFSIHVDLAEMRDWSPDKIALFFSGIAQILAAQNRDG